MGYIGKQPVFGNFQKLDDISSLFDGVTTTFDMKVGGVSLLIGSPLQLLVSLNGVLQEFTVSFSISNTARQIVFTTPPATGSKFFALKLGDVYAVPTVISGSINADKLATGAVITSKIADGAVTSAKIAAGGVGTGNLADASVATAKYADGSITLQKIQDSAISTTKIANSAVTFIKLAAAVIASQAEAIAGTAADRLMTPLSTKQAVQGFLGYSKIYESPEQTITSGGSVTLAHTLGTRPKFVQIFLVCKTAEHGYAVNDEIPITFTGNNNSAYGAVITYDTTNIVARYGNNTNAFLGLHKATGAGQNFTNTNWRLIVRAWG